MLTDSHLQPLALILFTCCGAGVYFCYEVLRAVRFQRKLPVLMHITDALFAVSVCAVFALLTHLFYSGIIKPYTLFCYALGLITARLSLKPAIRKVLQFVKRKYIGRKKRQNIRGQ
ncbi:MAG: hypothetical protein FWD49_01330 [Firmicutes bacterium]|nr:hypothetical protein [Bacillota bacterium]